MMQQECGYTMPLARVVPIAGREISQKPRYVPNRSLVLGISPLQSDRSIFRHPPPIISSQL